VILGQQCSWVLLAFGIRTFGDRRDCQTEALIAENFLHLDSTIDSLVSFPRQGIGIIWQLKPFKKL
jgi:hypothetical protein